MLRRIRIRTPPTLGLAPRPQWASRASQRQAGQQGRNVHYNPGPYYGGPPPRQFRSRLLDASIGATLTVVAYLGYQYYRLRTLRAKLEAMLVEGMSHVVEDSRKFRAEFAEARAAGDHARLRELTFGLLRNVWCEELGGMELGESYVDERGAVGFGVELGPLPGYAFDDERSGRELVPVEDTLMVIKRDAEQRIIHLAVAVNVDFNEVHRGLADPVADPEKDKLGELFERITEQVRFWKRMGKLREHVDGDIDLYVGLCLRDRSWQFDYAEGHFDALGWEDMADEPDEIALMGAVLRKRPDGQ